MGRCEVPCDGVRFGSVGGAEAGHRQGEGDAGGGDDGSDLHGLSPSATRKMPLCWTREKYQERERVVYYGGMTKPLNRASTALPRSHSPSRSDTALRPRSKAACPNRAPACHPGRTSTPSLESPEPLVGRIDGARV